MSVRVKPKPSGRKGPTTDQTSRTVISRRKRVSILPPSTTDPRYLLRCDDDAQKCDAKQPCTPCSDGGRSDCVYEQSRVKPRMLEDSPATIQVYHFSSENERYTCRSPFPHVNSPSSSLLTPRISPSEFNPPAPWERTTAEMELAPVRDECTRPLQLTPPSVLPSLWFPSVPRQLHTPLSSLGPERFQVSDTASSELDMALWVLSFLG